MNNEKKKDALTDLVATVGSQPSNQQPNNGTVSNPAGEKVELGHDIHDHIDRLVNIIKKKKKQTKEVLEWMVRKNSK